MRGLNLSVKSIFPGFFPCHNLERLINIIVPYLEYSKAFPCHNLE